MDFEVNRNSIKNRVFGWQGVGGGGEGKERESGGGVGKKVSGEDMRLPVLRGCVSTVSTTLDYGAHEGLCLTLERTLPS